MIGIIYTLAQSCLIYNKGIIYSLSPSLAVIQVLLSPCLQAIDFCTESYLLPKTTLLQRSGMIQMWNAYGVGLWL